MAEKKRTAAETAEENRRKVPVISDANRHKAKTNRIVSVILWVIALLTEVGAILILRDTLYIDNSNTRLIAIIALLAMDLILVIVGAQLWKKANRLNPISGEKKVKFFLWSQMGLIAAIICFLPVIIILLADKDLDKKTKKIVTVIAAIMLIIGALFSIDFDPVSAEELAEAQRTADVMNNGVVYWTRFGKSYHLDPNCQALKNSRESDIFTGTIEEAFEFNREDPCDFCALSKLPAADLPAEEGGELAEEIFEDAVQE